MSASRRTSSSVSKCVTNVVFAAALGLGGCAGMSQNETAGTVVGGVLGAVGGNQFGKGRGKEAMTAIGAIVGATLGHEIGRSLDETSTRRQEKAAGRALESGEVGQRIAWENPENSQGPAKGATVITRQGRDSDGNTCREFQQEVTIGGETRHAYGTACRDGNGDWQLVSR